MKCSKFHANLYDYFFLLKWNTNKDSYGNQTHFFIFLKIIIKHKRNIVFECRLSPLLNKLFNLCFHHTVPQNWKQKIILKRKTVSKYVQNHLKSLGVLCILFDSILNWTVSPSAIPITITHTSFSHIIERVVLLPTNILFMLTYKIHALSNSHNSRHFYVVFV